MDEPDLHWQDDELFLLSFLRARKFDVKRAFNLMKSYYVVRRKRAELYENVTFDVVKRTLEENSIGFLPYRDSEGCVILVIRVERWNPKVNSMADVMRTLTVAVHDAILSPATQIAGFKVIFDFSGLSLSHLPYVSPTYMLMFVDAIQTGKQVTLTPRFVNMHSKYVRYSENQTDFLPYELDYIPDDLRKRAKLELFEDEETRTHSLRLLRSMLKDEPNLHWQNDELFLLAFLRARKFDVKRAFHMMKTFYNVRGKRVELFDVVSFDVVTKTLEENSIGFLPYRDSEGCVILVMRVELWNPKVNSMGDEMRVLTTALMDAILSPATQIAGFKVIVDVAGLTVHYLPYVSPTYLWLLAEALQNCFPGRFKEIHLINGNAVLVSIWSIIKQFLTKKIKDRIHFHGKNVKKLHKYFSPRILPAEFGGELPPFDNTEWRNRVVEKADYFLQVSHYGYQKHNTQEKTSSDCAS